MSIDLTRMGQQRRHRTQSSDLSPNPLGRDQIEAHLSHEGGRMKACLERPQPDASILGAQGEEALLAVVTLTAFGPESLPPRRVPLAPGFRSMCRRIL